MNDSERPYIPDVNFALELAEKARALPEPYGFESCNIRWLIPLADEITRLRELVKWTANHAHEVQSKYDRTTEGIRDTDRADWASGKPGYEERSKERGLR